VSSFVVLPVLTMSNAPVGPISQAVIGLVNPTPIVSFSQNNIGTFGFLATNKAEDPELEARTMKASLIDGYFSERKMPLEGTGMKMVLEAEKNNLDWRLLPAIAIRESTGGKNSCKKAENNPFGWNSCKVGFETIDQAIETVAKNLGGNNPKTAHHYDDKTTLEILRAYNPPSVVPKYAQQVISIMKSIGAEELVIETTTKTTA